MFISYVFTVDQRSYVTKRTSLDQRYNAASSFSLGQATIEPQLKSGYMKVWLKPALINLLQSVHWKQCGNLVFVQMNTHLCTEFNIPSSKQEQGYHSWAITSICMITFVRFGMILHQQPQPAFPMLSTRQGMQSAADASVYRAVSRETLWKCPYTKKWSLKNTVPANPSWKPNTGMLHNLQSGRLYI